jgi:hypothetical protein
VDLHSTTELLKQWLPWVTVGGIVWRVWAKAKSSATTWADTLLDNHAKHMQESLARIEVQGDQQIELLTRIADK